MAFPFLQDFLTYFLNINVYLPIPTFGAMVAVAFGVSFWIFKLEIVRLENCGLVVSTLQPRVQFSSQMSNFSVLVMVSGMIGARLFHILEYPSDFISNPLGMIFSRGGFTVIGGLLIGTISAVWYLKRRGYPILPIADAAAPAMMLGYSIGRIGCQLAGDGDWGVLSNLALKPSWLPQWLWAHQYINNIVNEKIPYPGVYPTPIYESVAAVIIFYMLWKLRKNNFGFGWLFSLYLILSGTERFLVETIRVNSRYEVLGMSFTQAEALSFIFFVLGTIGVVFFSKKSKYFLTAAV